jgi:hypothetical protein
VTAEERELANPKAKILTEDNSEGLSAQAKGTKDFSSAKLEKALVTFVCFCQKGSHRRRF